MPCNYFRGFHNIAKAGSLEEVFKFGKENLGIQKYEGFYNLEVANWTNEVIVNINNKTKGKTRMPLEVQYEVQDDITTVSMSVVSGLFRIFTKWYFEN